MPLHLRLACWTQSTQSEVASLPLRPASSTRCCVQAVASFHLSSSGLPGSCDPVPEADEILQLAQPSRESLQAGKPERDRVIADLLKRLEDLTVALDDWQLVEQVGILDAGLCLSLGC